MAAKRKDSRGRNLKPGESQRADGLYRYRYRDQNGVTREVYSSRLVPTDLATRKRDSVSLRELEKQIEKDLMDGVFPMESSKITLDQLFDRYISNKTQLKASTLENYLYMYNKYIKPEMGYKNIVSLRYSMIKAFYCKLLDSGFKPNSLETIHTILHPTFQCAVRDGYIRTNPTDGAMADIKSEYDWERPKRHSLSKWEQEAFIKTMQETPMYQHWLPLFAVLLGTGCRIGEILGLRWVDCDFENNTININHTLVFKKALPSEVVDGCHMVYRITTPKTKNGVRTIPMLTDVRNALLQEKQTQELIGPCTSTIDGYTGFVFRNRYGNVLVPRMVNTAITRIRTLHNDKERELAEREGREPRFIRHFTCHNLRHTFATRLCENVDNLKVIQEIMGHANIETTMDIYAEATMEKKVETFETLNKVIKLL